MFQGLQPFDYRTSSLNNINHGFHRQADSMADGLPFAANKRAAGHLLSSRRCCCVKNSDRGTRRKGTQVLIESWRRRYNAIRRYSSVGYRPPAPEANLPPARGLPSAPFNLRAGQSGQPLAYQLVSRLGADHDFGLQFQLGHEVSCHCTVEERQAVECSCLSCLMRNRMKAGRHSAAVSSQAPPVTVESNAIP